MQHTFTNMPEALNLPQHLTGLTDAEVQASRATHGLNQSDRGKRFPLLGVLLDILKEPMLVLLISIAMIYLSLRQYGEAYFMLGALVIVSGISFYQDNRSRKALEALKKLMTPLSTVIRNGLPQQIPTEEIVPGDLVIAEEGMTINADGTIVHSHDFSVNESSLTGEAHTVYKFADGEDNQIYSGTIVSSGLAVYEVDKIGTSTRVGQLGTSLTDIREEPTPLQAQINTFVRGMAMIGIFVFLLVMVAQYLSSHDMLASLLKGLTLAMSILPEEIPVAFTTFMALGSRRLMKEGIIVKKSKTVETLGSATTICTDKTGTITENKMDLQVVYAFQNDKLYMDHGPFDKSALEVIEAAMWASEPVPFDPMEKTIHRIYESSISDDQRRAYTMVHEYPLGGIPPMMTHVFENESGHRILAAKGAPEAILQVSNLSEADKTQVNAIINQLAAEGYRMLGVALGNSPDQSLPEQQQQISFDFKGLIVFFDPPKPNISKVFAQFDEAGIDVKIITGDNPLTTRAIAKHAGFSDVKKPVNGEELMQLSEEDRIQKVLNTTLFTRMFPEVKLATINALKKAGEVVAMIGDGVNDAPALKASHIGIAMGKKGTEMAKSAADLILMDDDLSRLVTAIGTGRRIYDNLKKAIQYIISIHIPIILTVSFPLFLGWIYPDIFTPVHVIFLELVMGPTCSIVFENEPMEANTMQRPPRLMSDTFLSWKELGMSILQGLAITAGVLFIYQLAVSRGASEAMTRTMVFTTLVFANILLTLVNRSFYFSIWTTLRYKNRLVPGMILLTLVLLVAMLLIPTASAFFQLKQISWPDIFICLLAAAVSVFWFEGVKWNRRRVFTASQKGTAK